MFACKKHCSRLGLALVPDCAHSLAGSLDQTGGKKKQKSLYNLSFDFNKSFFFTPNAADVVEIDAAAVAAAVAPDLPIHAAPAGAAKTALRREWNPASN